MLSKSILLEKKNKENVLSSHLFSDDFVNTSFVNIEQNLDQAGALFLLGIFEDRREKSMYTNH